MSENQFMANGLHSSNAVEEYLIMTARKALDRQTWDDLSETEKYDGTIEWPDFDNISLDNQDYSRELEKNVDGNFQRLDEIYDALKASDGNPDRINSLRFLAGGKGERPKSDTTWWRWRKDYKESDLTENDELTKLGEKMLESSEGSDIEIPEIYRELRTTGSSSAGKNNGQKIKSFMLYGSGLDTGEVSQRVTLDREHLRQTRQNLVYDHSLMRRDGGLTADGREMYSLIVDQLGKIEDLT